ncbi:acyl-CoA synthetase [Acrocarpospora catenulata]|uniref:acyl-CoA synthetase n=1 Tax=Acrocarpospora catenulata TaxID=2836182 RepID=UPI001BD9FFBA|nr:acyl-CoA synthetase [Acrocarpospora catenulata]
MLVNGSGYDESTGRWVVPATYNVAVDATDRHPPGGLAIIQRDFTGAERFVTWAELRDLSFRFARVLLDRGARRGSVVAVLLPQSPEAAAAYLGALRIGAVLMTMSTLWAPEQIAARLGMAGAEVLVSDTATLTEVDVPSGVQVVRIDTPVLDGVSGSPLTAEGSADDPAHLYFTSGTTGPAKALVHAQRSLVGHNEFEYTHGLRPGEVFYGAGEWAWSHAKLFGPWRHGATQLIYRAEHGIDAVGLFTAMSDHKVRSALLNPTMLRACREQIGDSLAGLPWSFRGAASSNEPLDPGLREWFSALVGAPLSEYYGLTESYPMLGYAVTEPVRTRSTGRPLPGWRVELLDANGRPDTEATSGEVGLAARSNPQYPLGYWGDGEGTARAFGGDWFATGDEFRREDGYWYFVGRNDDVIKTSGYRIGPAEIEDVLLDHPMVTEAGVVGTPDERRGSIIHAYVAVPPGTDEPALVAELVAMVRERHSKFAYPRLVTFADRLPKSSTGKVQRAELRRRSAAGEQARTHHVESARRG